MTKNQNTASLQNGEKKTRSDQLIDIKNKNLSTIKEEPNGVVKIEIGSEPNGMLGMIESKTLNGGSSLPAVSATDRFMGLRDHLESLRQAQSGSMNLLDSTTQHLHDLMMSVGEEAKKDEEKRPWARDNSLAVKQTVDVVRQLHNVMRLKLDTVKALHKISKDIDVEDK